MTKYTLRLTGKDWRQASPGDPDACLLAVGLRRELGGNWSVAGNHATEFAGDGETIRRQLRIGADGRSIMRWFDVLGLKTGSTATFYGNVGKPRQKGKGKRKEIPPCLEPARKRAPLSTGQRGAIGATATGGVLAVTGFWWVDALAAGLTALGMGGMVAVRHGWVSVPKPSLRPARPEPTPVPSWRELRTMAPRERGVAYRRAVGAPEPLEAAPEPVTEPSVPVAPPAPPRPRWPVSAPREVPGVSHRSAIPDHVPAEMVREQERAQERGRP